ncbi:unnamed protein product, partial [Mesorhabditis belari]|uniref:Uncharacterized protein n=1 Tax=Mesorhabditis belari TaxID=2138241 RepID=A0AAF3EW04_9BILA
MSNESIISSTILPLQNEGCYWETTFIFSPTLNIIADFSYNIISPLGLSIVIERIVATFFVEKYEQIKPYPALIITVCISFGFGGILIVVNLGDELSFVLFGLSVGDLFILCGLLYLNRFNIRRCNSNVLSRKYQLTENIRILRILIPLTLLDNCVTITDFITEQFFNVNYIFDPKQCHRKDYIILFIVLRPWSILFELLIPLTIICRHPVYRRTFLDMIYGQKRRKQSKIVDIVQKKIMKNVLGEKVMMGNDSQQVFHTMMKMWDMTEERIR